MDYDVIVIGGGTAGVIAATQSARAGARTLLVEKNGILGGTITAAGVSFPGLFYAWGRQVIAGIGWELVTQCINETGLSLPNFSELGRPHWTYHVRVDPFVYAALCFQAVTDAGCELLLHTMVACVEQLAESCEIELCTKTGLKSVRARVLIDCTGDANAAMLAGAAVRVIDEPQPATLSCKASGYDLNSLDMDAINRAFDKEVKDGNLCYTDVGWNPRAADVHKWLSKYGENANHFHASNAHTSEGRTELERLSWQSFLRLFRFLKTQDGLRDLRISHVAQECGVRETVTIVGEETICVGDYVSGRFWDDAVCYTFYPIDLHELDNRGLDCRQLPDGIVPTVPRGALLPQGCSSLIVAGRCISSDRLANSALRVQASSMATGQVAGALAALCVSLSQNPRDVPYSMLCDLLKEHGAIVPAQEKAERQAEQDAAVDADNPRH